MATKIKQGDAYSLPVQIKLNGSLINADDVETVEFCLGDGLRKLYPGDVKPTNRPTTRFTCLSRSQKPSPSPRTDP